MLAMPMPLVGFSEVEAGRPVPVSETLRIMLPLSRWAEMARCMASSPDFMPWRREFSTSG